MNRKAKFINPRLEGPVSVLRMIAFIDPVPGKPVIKKRDPRPAMFRKPSESPGMPKEVIKAGAVDRVVPFDRISQKIIRRLHHS
jgi:hypothetical protein